MDINKIKEEFEKKFANCYPDQDPFINGSFAEVEDFFISKLTQAVKAREEEILEGLPKEKDCKLEPFPNGKEGVLDSETVPIAIANLKKMDDIDYKNGFNQCLEEVKKVIKEK